MSSHGNLLPPTKHAPCLVTRRLIDKLPSIPEAYHDAFGMLSLETRGPEAVRDAEVFEERLRRHSVRSLGKVGPLLLSYAVAMEDTAACAVLLKCGAGARLDSLDEDGPHRKFVDPLRISMVLRLRAITKLLKKHVAPATFALAKKKVVAQRRVEADVRAHLPPIPLVFRNLFEMLPLLSDDHDEGLYADLFEDRLSKQHSRADLAAVGDLLLSHAVVLRDREAIVIMLKHGAGSNLDSLGYKPRGPDADPIRIARLLGHDELYDMLAPYGDVDSFRRRPSFIRRRRFGLNTHETYELCGVMFHMWWCWPCCCRRRHD